MTVYFIINYDVTSPEEYVKYNPQSNPITFATIAKHGGEILVGTSEGETLSGTDAQTQVMIQFPSKDAALAWDNDPEYAEAKAIRLASTKTINAYIVDKLVIPE